MTTIQLRRGTAAEWTSADPTLSPGEPGVETDTGKFKLGDGSTKWTDLDYAVDVRQLPEEVLRVNSPAGQPVAPIYYDGAERINGGSSVNLAIGSSYPHLTPSVGYGYSNVAFGAGWQSDHAHDGNLGSVTTGFNNVAIGCGVLVSETTGNGNVAVGNDSLSAQSGSVNNTAVGQSAGLEMTTGSNNTMLGAGALSGETTGSMNTAVGNSALANQSGVSYSTAVGALALYAATAGPNDAFGLQALGSLTTGTANVAVGENALKAATTANANTALGNHAAELITGASNTAMGYAALSGGGVGGTARGNTAVGYEALYQVTDGYSNAAVGEGVLGNLTTGYSNAALGAGSVGLAIVAGSHNTLLGHNAGHTDGTTDSSDISNATLIGEQAQSRIDNVIVLGKAVADRPNLYFGVAPTADRTGGARGAFFIADAAAAPKSSDPSGGGYLYAADGALHWVGSGGTDTTIASA